MYAFNSAAIFYPGHPYIESTTVLSDAHGTESVKNQSIRLTKPRAHDQLEKLNNDWNRTPGLEAKLELAVGDV